MYILVKNELEFNIMKPKVLTPYLLRSQGIKYFASKRCVQNQNQKMIKPMKAAHWYTYVFRSEIPRLKPQ